MAAASSPHQTPGGMTPSRAPETEPSVHRPSPTEILSDRIESWRDRLLNLGNRNALINCRFGERAGLVRIDTPSTEAVWQTLIAGSAAGTRPMRFVRRRDLVPPPEGWTEFEDVDSDADGTSGGGFGPRKRRSWNPPLEECRRSPLLRDNDLLTDRTDDALDSKIRRLAGDAALAMSEQGVQSLYAVFGFLKWYESTSSDDARYSPLILVPVSLHRETTSAPWLLTEAEDEVVDNLCLRQRLWQEFRLELPPLPDVAELEAAGVPRGEGTSDVDIDVAGELGDRERYLESVRRSVAANERWEIVDRCVVGKFAFPKIAMWKDLGDHRESIMRHSTCRVLAGDGSIDDAAVADAFGPVDEVPTPDRLDDEIAPGELKPILDCDSSQLAAVAAARRGVSFVLDGPPGTGKSQTIANIIADALSVGRTVLFVSEKVSALEVVKERLAARGLDDFCLECHSNKAARRVVLAELDRCLHLDAERYPDATPKISELARRRDELNQYVRRLHQTHRHLGMSAFELYGRISRGEARGWTGRTRWSPDAWDDIGVSGFDDRNAEVRRAEDFRDVIEGYHDHPWKDCPYSRRTLKIGDDARDHLRLLHDRLSSIIDRLADATDRQTIGVSLPDLPDVVTRLRTLGSAPVVPAGWFARAAEVAPAVTRVLACEAEAADLIGLLEPSLAVAPEEAAASATGAVALAERWDTGPPDMPGTVRRRSDFVAARRQSLSELKQRFDELSDTMPDVWKRLGLDHVGVGGWRTMTTDQIAATFEAVRLSVDVPAAPRPIWTDPRRRSAVADLAERAGEKAAAHRRQSDHAAGFIRPRHLAGLAARVAGTPDIVDVFERLDVDGFADRASIDDAVRWAGSVSTFARRTAEASERLSDALGGGAAAVLAATPWEVASNLRSLVRRIIDDHAAGGGWGGGWSDPAIRERLRTAVTEVSDDLEEAARWRDELADRLSHRAFRDDAAAVAADAGRFDGWRRWLGGSAKYRRAAEDLYSDRPPGDRKTLVADMGRLDRLHRRYQSIDRRVEDFKPYLPPNFDARDRLHWRRLSSSLADADRWHRWWPSWPSVPIADVGEPLLTWLDAGGAFRDALRDADPRHTAALDPAHHDPVTAASLVESLALQSELWNAASELYRALSDVALVALPPVSAVPKFLEQMVRYHQREEDLKRCGVKYAAAVPQGCDSRLTTTWQIVADAVAAAAWFGRAGVRPDCVVSYWQNRKTETGDASKDSDERDVAGQLAQSWRDLNHSITAAGLDIAGRTLEAAEATLVREIDAWDDWRRSLEDVTGWLAEDIDPDGPAMKRLAGGLDRLAMVTRDRAAAADVLRDCGVGPVDPSHAAAATWLRAETDRGAINPLIAAFMADGNHRDRWGDALDGIDRCIDDAMRDAIDFLWRLYPIDDDPPGTDTATSDPVAGGTTARWLRMAAITDLVERVGHLADHTDQLEPWILFNAWRHRLDRMGLGIVVDELIDRRYAPTDAAGVVETAYHRHQFDRLSLTDDVLGEFDGDAHRQTRRRFEELDRWEVLSASTQIRQFQLNRNDRPSAGFAGAGSSELGILQREVAKKRRHKPLRRLFAEISGVLQRLKPCVMMSPLSVSTYLEGDDLRFDLVIFDEASQVFPWDAMGAIYRGGQLIVAGDDKQLPPTNFFARSFDDTVDDDEEDADDIGDFESVLSLCKSVGMPHQRLRWHYRSRREALIAFSNRHFYDGELVTFPSVHDATGDGVRLEHVDGGRWIDRKNSAEAERVVDLVLQHVRTRPDRSLGVIALNTTQQRTIEDTLYDRRRADPTIDALFGPDDRFGDVDEPLFIKNLETVQGDERDDILLSMGYGFNAAGKFNKNFGPINRTHGERRLNVAVTRARRSLTVVASVRAADMDLSGTRSVGAHLLKAYLDYAEHGVGSLSKTVDSLSGEFDSPFEEAVAKALIARGFDPVPQVGSGGFKIDLALKHPRHRGRFCLGIECDGATYHSSHTARDRDRIRQSILEGLGWRIIRVWSADWVRRPDNQLERIIAAYEQSIAPDAERPPTVHQPSTTEPPAASDLDPQIIVRNDNEIFLTKTFEKIDDVGDGDIRRVATHLLRRGGGMSEDDLIRETSRKLGFGRLGKRIRIRIGGQVTAMLSSGKLRHTGDRIDLNHERHNPSNIYGVS